MGTRTVDPETAQPALRAFDQQITTVAALILQAPELNDLDDPQPVAPNIRLAQQLFALPMREGGCSYRKMEFVAPMAFYGSTAQAAGWLRNWTQGGRPLALDYPRLVRAVEQCGYAIVRGALGNDPAAPHAGRARVLTECMPPSVSLEAALEAYHDNGPLADFRQHLQRVLTALVEQEIADRLRHGGSLSTYQLALLTSNQAKWSSAWLTTIPANDKPWLTLPDPHSQLAMRLRSAPLNAPDVLCVCGRAVLAREPLHPLHCNH